MLFKMVSRHACFLRGFSGSVQLGGGDLAGIVGKVPDPILPERVSGAAGRSGEDNTEDGGQARYDHRVEAALPCSLHRGRGCLPAMISRGGEQFKQTIMALIIRRGSVYKSGVAPTFS